MTRMLGKRKCYFFIATDELQSSTGPYMEQGFSGCCFIPLWFLIEHNIKSFGTFVS